MPVKQFIFSMCIELHSHPKHTARYSILKRAMISKLEGFYAYSKNILLN